MGLGPYVAFDSSGSKPRSGMVVRKGTTSRPKPVTGVAPLGAPAAPAVAAKAAADPVMNPWQPMVDAQVSTINAGADIDLAGLDEAEKFLRLDFGLVAQPDGSFAVDVNNPAGKAALLQRSYQQARRGDLNSMAARGLHNSGAYLRAQGERNRGEQMDTDKLVGALRGGLTDIGRSRDRVRNNAARGEADARLAGAQQTGGDSANTPEQSAPAATGRASGPGPGGRTIVKKSASDGKSYVYHFYPKGRSGSGKPEYVRIRPATGG